MNREEILSKVTKDKSKLDEMETATVIKALGISTIIVPIFCLIFIIARVTKGDAKIYDLLAITFAQLSIYEIYRCFIERKKGKLIFSTLLTVIAIASTLMFFFEV